VQSKRVNWIELLFYFKQTPRPYLWFCCREENPSFCLFYQSSTQTKTLALTLKKFFAYHGSAKVANANRSRLVFCENLQITICV
jgi:hypothetical protein